MFEYQPATGSSTDHQVRRPRLLRTQLLLWVNGTLLLALALFLVVDYRMELRSRFRDKQIALEEEAKTLLPALLQLRPQSDDNIQEFLNNVCERMQETQSPGHHIAARLDGRSVQASAHHRDSAAMLSAMEKAVNSKEKQARVRDQTLVVGSARQGNDKVYVSEYLDDLHRIVLRHVLWRVSGVVVLGVLAAAVVSLVLMRLVAKPVERLAETVRQIAGGRMGLQCDRYRTAELASLAAAINEMSLTLAANEAERKTQMAKASRIQENLLPRPVCVEGVVISHLYVPTSEVAGDYFDILPLSDGNWLFCVADVTGHGVPAAMEAVILKTLLMEAKDRDAAPHRVLGFVNDRFAAMCLPGDFASMIAVRWDPRTATVEYASAGHEPAYLVPRNGAVRELRATGPLLGIQNGSFWQSEILPLSQGDRLFLVTDGLAETVGADGICFGRDRLRELIGHRRVVSLEEIMREVNRALVGHRGGRTSNDDVTVLAIEFTSVVEARPETLLLPAAGMIQQQS